MFITKNINLTCRTIHLCLHQICKTNILFIMKNCRWSGYNLHFYNIGGKKVTSISFFYCYSLDKKKSMNYLTPVGISVRSVVTIRSSVSIVAAIVSIPGISLGFSGSGRFSFSFPLLPTPISVSVSVVSVVGSVSVVTAIVSIPGIGFGFGFSGSGRSSFSFPLLSTPVSVSVSVVSVVGSVSVVTAIVSIPGIGFGISFGYSGRFSFSFPLLSAPVSVS